MSLAASAHSPASLVSSSTELWVWYSLYSTVSLGQRDLDEDSIIIYLVMIVSLTNQSTWLIVDNDIHSLLP